MLNILLLGDTSGKSDEGMKKIARSVSRQLCRKNNINVVFASTAEVFRNPGSYAKTDILHYMAGPSWRSFLYVFLIKLLLGRRTKTVISFIHPRWSILASIFFRLLKPDAVIIQSPKWKQYCQSDRMLISEQLLTGVDFTKFKPVSQDKQKQIRKELDLPLDKKIILHVGHLNLGRNLSCMTEFSEDEDILPIVIGSTTVMPDIEIANNLKKSGVYVIDNYIENIETFYQAADCYIFPTVDPMFCVQIPLSVLEALACGLPVVSTRFEGLPYYILDGFEGLKYIDQLDQIKTSVRDMIDSGIKPDTTQLSEFSWDEIADGLLSFYNRILTT